VYRCAMKRIALLFLLAAGVATFAKPATVTTVILVRHAEKAAPSGDVKLSVHGTLRAEELARVLADARISAIFTTELIRTGATAAPLAAALNITPTVIHTGPTYAANVVANILANQAGKTVLVVGHTDTTVAVLNALHVTPPPTAIPETQFDNLFICTLVSGQAPVLTTLRYGAAAR